MRVAIHQPNYLPWPGYFAKMAQSDRFVFLDDAQFSKNNIINRVRIRGADQPRWLTLPVAVHLGQEISQTMPATAGWRQSSISLLYNTYRKAVHFSAVWPSIEKWFASAPDADLAAINIHFITALAAYLRIDTPLQKASDLQIDARSDDRLIDIVGRVAPQGVYLSGRGGAGYQNPEKFLRAGLGLEYYKFEQREYDQGQVPFQAGLSVLDMLFCLGQDGTAGLIHEV